jgi:signal transduction histidine kinase
MTSKAVHGTGGAVVDHVAPPPDATESEVDELLRAEGSTIVARWIGVAFAILQVSAYDAQPYPAGVQTTGYLLIAVLAVGNLLAAWAVGRTVTLRMARWVAGAGLAFDVVVLASFVWLYAFDGESVMFLLFFVLPAEAAAKFRLPGAMAAWAGSTVLYVARELWAADRYGFELSLPSITFRMGVLLIVAVIVGLFASKLARRTAQLRTTLRELRSEEQWRSGLIDMLAHDLRAPVGGAASTMLLISKRAETLDTEQIRRLADTAARQSGRAVAMAEDLLDLARAREGRLRVHREVISVADAARRTVTDLAAEDTDVTVDVEPSLQAHVDPQRLGQILTNLVSNAQRHGRPPVSVTAHPEPDHGVAIRVTDSGTGIPPGQQTTLFEPFAAGARADSVGLGLWVVATLAAAHGGSVVYETVDGRPSFLVTLPGEDQ